MAKKENSDLFILLFLGLLSAFGPFVMDMYLPTLPAMADYFATSSSMVQLGLTASMVGIAAGQLVFGPLSDTYGRRRPLLAALGLFLLSTVGCIFSTSVTQFIAMRFVQGVAGAGGVVLSRSIATDRYSAGRLARMLATIGAINGVATVVAPIGGGALADEGGWQEVFWFLFLLGAALLFCGLRLRESLPAEGRTRLCWSALGGRFVRVLRDRQYLCYVLQYGFTMGVLFVNIASAPFIMQEHYGLSPLNFSLCFGINAIAMVIASAIAARFPSMEKALRWGSDGMLLLSVPLLLALYFGCDFWVYEGLVFCLLAMVGLTFTASNTLAMDRERHNAGIASAVLGAAGFAFGGFVSPLVGVGDLMLSTGGLFVVGSLCACLCARYAVGLRREVSASKACVAGHPCA